MELVVIGLSHRTAPVDLRERVAFSPGEVEDLLRRQGATGGISERLLLSTCNRTELYTLSDSMELGRDHFLDLLRKHRGVDLSGRAKVLYLHAGREMVAHLFRVASSIDSMVVGEAQILGQVHEAFEIAERVGSAGPLIHRLLDFAFRVGKRVRKDTDIAIGAVSVASAAVTLATRIFSQMQGRTALLVGSGETGELAARHLLEQGIGELLVTSRTHEHAAALAEKLHATSVAFPDLEGALGRASIVITATASPEPLIREDLVRRVVSARRNRPLLIVDIGVPRDVEPDVQAIRNVFLYDIDDLNGLVAENLERRRHEIPKVEAIILHELDQFFRWYSSLEVAPVIRDLRERFEAVRAAEVERHARRFCEKDREQIDAITRGIVNKLLHEPMVNIRRFQRHGSGALARLDTVRRLFGLGEGRGDESD